MQTTKVLTGLHMIHSDTEWLIESDQRLSLILLFLNQNICCEYSKEPSQWDDSYKHPNTCADLETFVRGVQLRVFFFFLVD